MEHGMYETAETSTNYLHLPFFLFQSFDTFLDKILNKKWNGKTWTSTEVKHKWITKHGKCKLIGFLWNKWFQSNIVALWLTALYLFSFFFQPKLFKDLAFAARSHQIWQTLKQIKN